MPEATRSQHLKPAMNSNVLCCERKACRKKEWISKTTHLHLVNSLNCPYNNVAVMRYR